MDFIRARNIIRDSIGQRDFIRARNITRDFIGQQDFVGQRHFIRARDFIGQRDFIRAMDFIWNSKRQPQHVLDSVACAEHWDMTLMHLSNQSCESKTA